MDVAIEPYDIVHTIKSNALARYKLFTNITKLLHLIEVFIAVAFISWSSIRLPFVFKFSTEYLLALTSYLMNQHVVFLVGNAIVFACYILSHYTNVNESCGSQILYDKCEESLVTFSKTVTEVPNPKPVRNQVTENMSQCKDIMIPLEKTMNVTVREQEVAHVTVIKKAAKQIERFRRTQSDLKSKISVKPQRELRRSVTSCRGESKSFPRVDELSNEEFRIAVERFISQQQRILRQQSLVVDGN